MNISKKVIIIFISGMLTGMLTGYGIVGYSTKKAILKIVNDNVKKCKSSSYEKF